MDSLFSFISPHRVRERRTFPLLGITLILSMTWVQSGCKEEEHKVEKQITRLFIPNYIQKDLPIIYRYCRETYDRNVCTQEDIVFVPGEERHTALIKVLGQYKSLPFVDVHVLPKTRGVDSPGMAWSYLLQEQPDGLLRIVLHRCGVAEIEEINGKVSAWDRVDLFQIMRITIPPVETK